MLEKIKEVMVETLNIDGDDVVATARLKEDLAIDSLSAVELLLELENQFDVKIEDDEFSKLETVQDVIDIVEKLKAN